MVGAGWQFVHYTQNPHELPDAVQQNPNISNDPWKPLHVRAAREGPHQMIHGFAYPEWTQLVAGIATLVVATLLAVRGRGGSMGRSLACRAARRRTLRQFVRLDAV